MVFVPATNCLQMEVRGTYQGQDVEITQYFAHTGVISSADVEDLFDWYETVFLPDLVAPLSNSWIIDELYATDLTTVTSPTYARVLSPVITGGESGSPGTPGSIATCVSFRSANRGRSGRGRNYVPGLTEGQVTGNDANLTTIGLIISAYELLLGGGTFPATFVWSILSRYTLGAPRAAGLIQTVLDVLSTDFVVDSQRGRLRGD